MTSKPKAPDRPLTLIADYMTRYKINDDAAYKVARCSLLDALACIFHALPSPECHKLLGPVVPGTLVPNGVRVPGTHFELDPIKAAFDMGTAIRWLDYNDAWFAAEAAHPSDNLGAILAVADYMSRRGSRLTVRDVLTALIKAYEIQGVLALKNNYMAEGLDSVGMLNVSSSAVATHLLGGSRQEIVNALSNAWLDGISPRLYRIGEGTGWRKAWASGDATSRGVMHGLFALRGEMGYPAALSAKRWGFCDVVLKGKPIVLDQAFGTFIINNILFKVPYPAQFHTQTASECAHRLHPLVKDRIDDIRKIHLRTHTKTLQTSVKTGPLHNAADRDHCLQYIVAIVLLHGKLEAEDYEDGAAADPRIDALRDKMVVTEDQEFTRGFSDPRRRNNANAIRIEFRDSTRTPDVVIEYPLGHPRRRREGIPMVEEKFRRSVELTFPPKRQRQIMECCGDMKRLTAMPVHAFMDMFVK